MSEFAALPLDDAPAVPGPPARVADPEGVVHEQLAELERAARASLRADGRERVRFWLLAGVSLTGAAGAGVAAWVGAGGLGALLGAGAALATVADAALRATAHRPLLHLAAALGDLAGELRIRWAKVQLSHPDPTAPQRVAHAMAMLDAVQAKRGELAVRWSAAGGGA